jgi:hypothetical protein
MTRLGAVFWGGLVLASGFVTFNVKYAVQGIEDELARVRRQTIAEQQEIRVLSAEWAYLNQPDRLAELNRNFLQLAPMTAKQLQGRVEEIALRPPPAGIADAMIAANLAGGSPLAAMPAVAGPPAVTLAAAVSAVPLAAVPARATRAGGSPVAAVQTAEALAGGGRAADTQETDVQRTDIQRTDIQGTQTKRTETQLADAIEAARAADGSGDGAVALAEALRLLGVDTGGQTPRVRLAKAAPASLDALISKIADTR